MISCFNILIGHYENFSDQSAAFRFQVGQLVVQVVECS